MDFEKNTHRLAQNNGQKELFNLCFIRMMSFSFFHYSFIYHLVINEKIIISFM